MVRHEPPSDWFAYGIVIAVVILTMVGKFLLVKGDEPVEEALKDGIKEIEQDVVNLEEKIEEEVEHIKERLS
jgi:hypothetical protein